MGESYATFYAGAVWKVLSGPKPDVAPTLTAAPGLAWIGWLFEGTMRAPARDVGDGRWRGATFRE